LAVPCTDAQARARIRREAEAASGLNHPHIITVHDVGEHEGRQYVADGIAAAHAAGELHRDIKPGNILIGANGYAKLADFGSRR
jgi:serine/threonine protein kinase